MSIERQADVEHLLAPGAIGSIDDWRRVKDYLAWSFAAFLGQRIEPLWEPIYEDISPGWGFSFGFRGASSFGGFLGLEWYGVISHNSGHTCALILLFAQDQRITPCDGKEYLYFEFRGMAGGSRGWQSLGWGASEMHEWDGYQRLSEVCRQMSQAASPPDR